MTIQNVNSYVEKYNKKTSGHSLVDEDKTYSIKLIHDGTGWKPAEGSVPVVVDVKCQEEPTDPDIPTEEQVATLLGDSAVKVSCVRDGSGHGAATYALVPGTYALTYSEADPSDGRLKLTVTVSVPGDYVSKYTETNGEHALDPEGQVEAYIKDLELVKPEGGAWKIEGSFDPAAYTVSCEESEPTAPTPDQVADLLDTTAVRVKCVREGSGHEFIDYALETDTYSIEVGKVSGSKVQATVKVSDPSYYVDRFCDNTGTEHRLDPEEQSEKAETINLAYLEGQGWYLDGGYSPVTYTVTCEGGSNPGGGGGGQTTYFEIEASAGGNGSISPSGTQTVAKGGSKTFTFTPDEGYTVGNVTVDGVSMGRCSSYTFTNVQADHTISVTFMQGSAPADPDDTGVSDWLNTTDHLAFLNGYGDGNGLFGPENNMTRGEAAQMFYNMLLDKTPGDIEVSFEDLDENAFYYEPVMVLASHGIIKGTSPTTFEPTRPIARAEFVAMAMRFSNGEAEVSENIFVDVADDAWYRDYVLGAVSYGWIYGYQDGSHRFGPTDTIRRSEAAAVANRMLGRVADGAWINAHEDELKLFPDVPRSHWGFFEIVEATNSHDYEKDGSFENWTGLKK